MPKIYLFLSLTLFSNFCLAASKSPAKFADRAFVGFGAGAMTFYDPPAQFDADGSVVGMAGIEGRLFKSSFLATFGVTGTLFAGERMDYEFKGTDGVDYADEEMNWSGTSNYLYLGLKYRLVDASGISLYAEGGGLIGTISLTYDTVTSDVAGAGDTYATAQKEIYISGNYIEAGLDLMPLDEFGVRLGFRLATIKSRTIHAIGEHDVKWQEAHGFIAIIREI